MPSRLLREGILTSERVDALDFAAEVFYRRLMSKVDDHGLFDARPSILRAALYPLRLDRVREADITRWMAICQKAGLLALYSCDDKPYLQMLDTKWAARSDPKFPLPSTANTCLQPQTPVLLDVVVDVVVSEEEQEAPPSATPAKDRATRLAADWLLPDDWKAWAKAERPDLDAAKEGEKFADYWRARPGKDGRKLDWLATWRNWIRNASTGRSGSPAVPARSVAGNSPVVPNTPSERLAAARAFWGAEVREGRVTPGKAREELAKVEAKYA